MGFPSGGGQGCREVMQMVEQGWLGYLRLEILAVADIRADLASGLD